MPRETDASLLVSPLQRKLIDTILAGFFGEKKVHNKLGGRANVFTVIYAWAICAGMSPNNI